MCSICLDEFTAEDPSNGTQCGRVFRAVLPVYCCTTANLLTRLRHDCSESLHLDTVLSNCAQAHVPSAVHHAVGAAQPGVVRSFALYGAALAHCTLAHSKSMCRAYCQPQLSIADSCAMVSRSPMCFKALRLQVHRKPLTNRTEYWIIVVCSHNAHSAGATSIL